MTNTTTAIKTWNDGQYSIVKTRDEDGDIIFEAHDADGYRETFDGLTEAREWVRFERNQELADEAQELIGDLDFDDPATAKKLKAVLAFLNK